MTLTESEKELLYALQCGLPLTRRPFAAMGAEFGFAEKDAVAFAARLFADGVARRLGAVFNCRRLGYRSALCAITLPNDTWVEAVASVLVPHPGVTHCHERAWPSTLDRQGPGNPRGQAVPNLWFTCIAPRRRMDEVLLELRDRVHPAELLVMPAHTCFKLDEVYDPRQQTRLEGSLSRLIPEPPIEDDPGLTAAERTVVRHLQRSLHPAPDLFGPAAAALGMPVDTLLDLLRGWRERGILRRFSLTLRQEAIGYTANGMGFWSVAPSELRSAGRSLAALPEVTHCYERTPSPGFPYNLSATIHGSDWEQVHASFIHLTKLADLKEGRMLCSVREFKNTLAPFFSRELEPAPRKRRSRVPASAR